MKTAFACVSRIFSLEAKYVFTNKTAFVTVIIMPCLWIAMLIGMFHTGIFHQIPFGIVNFDQTSQSQAVVSRLNSLPSLTAVSYTHFKEAYEDTRSGKIIGFAVIPENFVKRLGTKESDAIELYYNKTLYPVAVTAELDTKAAILEGLTEIYAGFAALAGANSKQASSIVQNISVNNVMLGNIAFNFLPYLLATLAPGVLQLIMVLACATSYAREYKERTAHIWLKNAGGSLFCAVSGKVAFYASFYIFLGLAYIAYIAGWCGFVSEETNLFLWVFTFLSLLCVMGCVAFFLVNVLYKLSTVIAIASCVIYCAPIYPYTGFAYPLDSMTPGAKLLYAFFPLTYFIKLQAGVWIVPTESGLWLKYWLIMASFGLFTAIGGAAAFKLLKLGEDA